MKKVYWRSSAMNGQMYKDDTDDDDDDDDSNEPAQNCIANGTKINKLPSVKGTLDRTRTLHCMILIANQAKKTQFDRFFELVNILFIDTVYSVSWSTTTTAC